METVRILDIKRFAVHDGDGIRTTLFLKGCPLRCIWCHNPEGLDLEPQIAYYANKCINCGECAAICEKKAHTYINNIHRFNRALCVECGGDCEPVCLGKALKYYGKEVSVEQILPELLEDKLFYDNSGGGITISGGEALIHPEFCQQLLKALKKEGINTAVDTCGFVNRQAFEKVIPYTDTFLYDIKAIDEDVHIKCTGHSNKLILENLKFLDEQNCRIEIRIPFVPGYNDDQIEKIAFFLKSFKNIVRVRVLPYHNYAGSKYESLGMQNKMPSGLPDEKTVKKVQELFD